MKRWIVFLALALALVSGTAAAQPAHPDGGLGFHETDAPIGLRWWFSGQRMALDLGIGFGSEEVADEDLSHFAFDVGLPIMLRSWDRVHFMVRPGIVYRSQEVFNPPPAGNTDTDTQLVIQGELEAEVFLVDNVSVSAAHGLAITNTDFAAGGSATDFSTTGSNFTTVGFHVYLFGGAH